MATEHSPLPDPSEPAQPDTSASTARSALGSKPETGNDRKPPHTLVLRPQSAVVEEHLGLLVFHLAGMPMVDASRESAICQALPTTNPHSNPNTPDPSPFVCVLAFQRFDWNAEHPAVNRFLGDVVRWASKQSMPLPSRIHAGTTPRNRSRLASTAKDRDPNRAERAPFEQRALWILIRDVATAYVVAVDDRTHRIGLLPCPSIRKNIPTGSLDAASTWLPERWFNQQCMALMRRLRDIKPTEFQKSFDFDGPASLNSPD